MSSLREALRQATQPIHRALEDTPLMQSMMRSAVPLPVYGAYLARQWWLHEPLENDLRRCAGLQWAAPRLCKSQWAQHDLHALAIDVPLREVTRPVPRTQAEALGILYVLEGATLGLQATLRRLPAAHPAHARAGRFMQAYGAHTADRWRAFLQQLEAAPHAEHTAVIRAAEATFAAFFAVFSEAGYEQSH